MTAGGMSNSVGPRATRIVDGTTYAVELDLNPIAASLLTDLARSTQTWRLEHLKHRQPGSAEFTRHLAALTADPTMQAALTQLIHPDAAEQLSSELWESKDEPGYCTSWDCANYATVLDLCGDCQQEAEAKPPAGRVR